MAQKSKKITTAPLRGMQDFYPDDQALQKSIFKTMSKTVERFGYEEYSASIMEPSEIYRNKTSEEIVNDQTYTFTDRGGREITLRPEMTPTVARMVAGRRRELLFPLRWYSLANCFRYERPQRGRSREFWQLNVDLFGVESLDADIEIITIADAIMKAFGAKDGQYKIYVSHKHILPKMLRKYRLDDQTRRKIIRVLDTFVKGDEAKLSSSKEAEQALNELMGIENRVDFYKELQESLLLEDTNMQQLIGAVGEVAIANRLLTRGFDYYTGMIFEVFDTNPKNNRSLFGGGRYDNLLSSFGEDSIPAVGFGMGNSTLKNFLESHDLLANMLSSTTPSQLFLATEAKRDIPEAMSLANELRAHSFNVEVNLTAKPAGEQRKHAEKKGIPYVITVGKDSWMFKAIKTNNEITLKEKKVAEIVAIFEDMADTR